MELSDLRIGCLAQGEFRRLAPHTGAFEAFYDYGITFDRIVGGSAGAIMGAAVSPWTKRNFNHVREVVLGLTSKKIFTIPLEHKASGLLAAGALSFPLINHLEPNMRLSAKVGLHVLQSLGGLALGADTVRRIFSAKSLFDNSPLEHLLNATYDFEGIRKARTEVRIMATDVETGEHVAFSTKEDGLTLSALVGYVIASATLPVYFPLRRIGGRLLTDAEVKTNFPIGQLEDMDLVFVLHYTDGTGDRRIPRTWGDHYNAMFDIAKAEINTQAVEQFEARRRNGERLPEVVFIRTARRVPPLTMDAFSRSALERSIALGYEMVCENEALIGNAIGRTMERVEALGHR